MVLVPDLLVTLRFVTFDADLKKSLCAQKPDCLLPGSVLAILVKDSARDTFSSLEYIASVPKLFQTTLYS